eukprot:TRINITY_DN66171_c0_g1_i1.p1 TRINITY_DN66171_c0_g1~~TRINITY_DN66171_c0_g1_i1.p1  ORF type:complete len:421 (+),score=86.13 TRINITY_DN66171_c0_g1_i1:77-1339(+)
MKAALVAISFSQCLVSTQAWGTEGHAMISRIAESLLPGKKRDQIRTMMHGDPGEVAFWEEVTTKKYPETDVLHWQRQTPEWTCRDKGVEKSSHIRCDNTEPNSLFCGLAYFFGHFADEMLLEAFPEPRIPINTPRRLTAMKNVDEHFIEAWPGKPKLGLKQKTIPPATHLRWITSLIGDLHQPLHWLNEYNHGKKASILWKDDVYDLLTFWEEEIVKHLPPPPPQSAIDLALKHEQHQWGDRLPTELFREWAQEMSMKVCTQVYEPMMVNHKDGTRGLELGDFKVSDELFEEWKTMAAQLIQEGGERLALVYLDILEHKRHKQARHEGRGIAPPLELSKHMKKHDHNKWDHLTNDNHKHIHMSKLLQGMQKARRKKAWSNLTNNLLLALFVVPGTILLLNMHFRMGHKAWCYSKREERTI